MENKDNSFKEKQIKILEMHINQATNNYQASGNINCIQYAFYAYFQYKLLKQKNENYE